MRKHRRGEWQFAHGEYASVSSYAHGESHHLMQSSSRANGMMKDGAIITKGEWNDEGWSNHHQGRME